MNYVKAMLDNHITWMHLVQTKNSLSHRVKMVICHTCKTVNIKSGPMKSPTLESYFTKIYIKNVSLSHSLQLANWILYDHMVGHPRCVFINYIWLNQLSNTTNLRWIDVYYLVINYMFRRLWPSSGWWINKTHISSYIWHASFIRRMGGGVIGWGYEISCVNPVSST